MRTGRYLRGIFALLLCGALAACANGGSGGTGQRLSQVTLSLTTDKTTAGETVTLHAANTSDLHQLSCRIAYNPLALRFVDAQRGELVDTRALFFTTSKGETYVPVAFTYHAGEAIPDGYGDVAELHFEVLDANADPQLAIIEDEDLLLARDWHKHDVPVRVEGVTR
jgi:hypothetical protein